VSRWLAIAAICAGCGRFGFGADVDAATGGSGGGSDAGSGSATGSDSGGGPSCDGFDLCDQFEDSVLSSVWETYGAVTHSTLAHRGAGSVHFSVPAVAAGGMSGALIREKMTLGTATPAFWVRVWVRFGALADVQNHLEFLSADEFTGGGLGDYLFTEADSTDLYSQFDNHTAFLPMAIPLDTWTCLIWHVAPNDGVMDLDGDLGSSSFSGTTNGTPPISVIEIGPNLDPTNVAVDQSGFEVWVDDVIVHHAAVTCAD
jgi:hypothetical protein